MRRHIGKVLYLKDSAYRESCGLYLENIESVKIVGINGTRYLCRLNSREDPRKPIMFNPDSVYSDYNRKQLRPGTYYLDIGLTFELRKRVLDYETTYVAFEERLENDPVLELGNIPGNMQEILDLEDLDKIFIYL